MGAGLWEFIKWAAATVQTGDYLNEWFYDMVGQYGDSMDLLMAIGKQLKDLF